MHTSGYVHDNSIEHFCFEHLCQQSQFTMPIASHSHDVQVVTSANEHNFGDEEFTAVV